IKTSRYTVRDLAGLLEFTRRHPAFRPLVLCPDAETGVARAAGAEAVTWRQFLWSGPPGTHGR
ncbi:MAG: hypothetical protein PVG79_17610, partial [Gemmatimonadales bacterium]